MKHDSMFGVVGVGGAGCNIVRGIEKHFKAHDIPTNNLIIMNTDIQSLNNPSSSLTTLQLGENGLGAGSNPEIGKQAAEYSYEDIIEAIRPYRVIILCTGLGGGTGSGAAPVIARIARDEGKLIMSMVVTPFKYEGKGRSTIADKALEEIKKFTDIYISISNQELVNINANKNFRELFADIESLYIKFIKALIDIVYNSGYMNIDYSDIATTINKKGASFAGTGFARGNDSLRKAIQKAVSNPLLKADQIVRATNGIIHIVSNNLLITQLDEISSKIITPITGRDIDIKFGLHDSTTNGVEYDDSTDDSDDQEWTYVMVLLTGLEYRSLDDQSSAPVIENSNIFNLDF